MADPNIPRFLKIDESNHHLRDTHSMGVINTNTAGLLAYQRRKELIERQLTQEKQQKIEINNLRNELAEMKSLLMDLVKKEK